MGGTVKLGEGFEINKKSRKCFEQKSQRISASTYEQISNIEHTLLNNIMFRLFFLWKIKSPPIKLFRTSNTLCNTNKKKNDAGSAYHIVNF